MRIELMIAESQPAVLPLNYGHHKLAPPERLELPTPTFVALYSNPLSYGDILERAGRVELRIISLEDCWPPLAAIYPHKWWTDGGSNPD